jgi:hypothetical protein
VLLLTAECGLLSAQSLHVCCTQHITETAGGAFLKTTHCCMQEENNFREMPSVVQHGCNAWVLLASLPLGLLDRVQGCHYTLCLCCVCLQPIPIPLKQLLSTHNHTLSHHDQVENWHMSVGAASLVVQQVKWGHLTGQTLCQHTDSLPAFTQRPRLLKKRASVCLLQGSSTPANSPVPAMVGLPSKACLDHHKTSRSDSMRCPSDAFATPLCEPRLRGMPPRAPSSMWVVCLLYPLYPLIALATDSVSSVVLEPSRH